MKLTKVQGSLKITEDNSVGKRIFAGGTMIYGDTGWRDVTELLTPSTYVSAVPGSASHGIFVKRVNNEVFWKVRLVVSSALIGVSRNTRRTFLNFPPGMAQNPPLYSPFAVLTLGAGTIQVTNASGGSVMQTQDSSLGGSFIEGEILSGSFNYSTTQSWPAFLAGLPA